MPDLFLERWAIPSGTARDARLQGSLLAIAVRRRTEQLRRESSKGKFSNAQYRASKTAYIHAPNASGNYGVGRYGDNCDINLPPPILGQ